MSELLLAVSFIQDFIEQVVLQLVCLDHFLGIKLDVPEQFLKTVAVLEIGLGLVDHPDVKIGRLVDHFLDLEDEVAHALCHNDLLVYASLLHVVDGPHLMVEGGQVSRDLLNKVVVHLDLVIFHGFASHQPNDIILCFGDESLLFKAFRASVSE